MASYNGKYGATALETVGSNEYSTASPTKGSKMKAHFKRFWWLHLINFAIGTVIVTLILVFVGMPNIAQKGINDAWLTLESQVVTNPRPDAVHVRMNITSHSKSMFHPRLDAFPATLFLEDTLPELKPFGTLQIPSIIATAEATILIDQDLKFVDLEQFSRYNERILQSDTYRVAQRARVGLKEGAFPKTTVDFNKVITSKGFNNLKGFEVRDISISLVPQNDVYASNMKATVFIPNPSPITVEMGTVFQEVFVGDKMIATAIIPNLTLKPGDNLIPMVSVSDQAAVIGLITTQYKDGKVPVTIKGKNSTVNGVDLPYFTRALKAQTLYTTLDLAPALKATGLDLNALNAAPGPAAPGSAAPASSTSTAAVAAPPAGGRPA